MTLDVGGFDTSSFTCVRRIPHTGPKLVRAETHLPIHHITGAAVYPFFIRTDTKT